MSVPEGKRTESKLEVQTRARELAKYTMTICNNEKVFPKRDRWLLTNRIVSTTLTIMEEIDLANDIRVTNKNDYEIRNKSQTVALASTAKLLGLMELAYSKYSISSEKIRYWTGLVVQLRQLIIKWRQSDKKRYV